MFYPSLAEFQIEFLSLENGESDEIFASITSKDFLELNRTTKEKVRKAEIPINGSTEKKLLENNTKARQLYDLHRSRVELLNGFYEDGKRPSLLDANKTLLETWKKHCDLALEGIEVSQNFIEAKNRLFDHIEDLFELSSQFSEAVKKENTKAIAEIVLKIELFPEYWEGWDTPDPGILKKKLYFRGCLYLLALFEAFWLSEEDQIPGSLISEVLLNAPYCDDNCKPMQRFFSQFSSKENEELLSINNIGREIGFAKLEHDFKTDEVKCQEDLEALISCYIDDEKTAKASEESIEGKYTNSWKSSFKRDLATAKVNSDDERVFNKYTVEKADFFLKEIRLKKFDDEFDSEDDRKAFREDYRYDLYWLVFIAARSFHRVWFEYEVMAEDQKNSVFPDGISSFLKIYEPAYQHAVKVVAGEKRTFSA
ncbi:hypothetical protein A9Q83_04145 [Alphaproteobacteria bacterium 46_93_T64]|nr:hypothetical protein A9Q83_04145 [Alphaproteobacteria bacterium 46_93_T64]